MRTRLQWCLLALLAVAAPARAQEVRLGGSLQLERRLSVSDSARFSDFYSQFRPVLNVMLGERAETVVSLDMRFHDFSREESPGDLSAPDIGFPNTLTVWEGFVRIPSFLAEPLDVTIGKQRIPWGTADGLNPTDRFNAYDLSDLTDFTRRIPTWAVRTELYLRRDWVLDAVWAPTSHGPLLSPAFGNLLSSAGAPEATAPVAVWVHRYEPPAPRLGNGSYGLRISGFIAGMDVGLSFFDGLDGMPVTRRVEFAASGTPGTADSLEAHVWSTLPRLRTFGADLAGEWRGFGVWAEAALVDRPKIEILPTMPDSTTTTEPWVVLDGKPYGSWTLGGDRTFRHGVYLNLQWAHGLFFEQEADRLHDYVLGRVERGFLRDALAVALEGAIEVGDWSNARRDLGYGLFPSLTYSPVDDVGVTTGAFLVDGRGQATFHSMSGADQVYVRVRVEF